MKTLDTQRTLDTATAFFLAGERCAPDLQFGNYGLHSVTAPRIVCYAFAVELALKLLVNLTKGYQPGGHSLRQLYNELAADVSANLPHLRECVDEIDRYFVDWRYPFEKEMLFGDFDDPRRAFIECHREIRRLQPNLISIYEANWGTFEPDWYWAWPKLEVPLLEMNAK